MMKRFISAVCIPITIPCILLLTVCLCSLNACKKNSTPPPSNSDTVITFKANGVMKNYTIVGYNTFMDGNTYVCNINGTVPNTLDGERINLLVKSQSPIVAGTYGNDNSGTSVQYHTSDNLTYTVINTDIHIVIDKFENNLIQGSFTATIPTDADPIKLTEGAFKAGPRN